MNLRTAIRASTVAALFLGAMCAHSQDAATAPPPVDPQVVADGIAAEVAQIRGLPFKQPVGVELQSGAQFAEYVSRRLDEVVPEPIRRHYGLIVRTLGLYRGPPIDDFSSMMTTVMSSQVGAYYDPEKKRFYVVMGGLPELMQGVLYSHELYHALQDQHFGLTRYLETGPQRGDPSFSSDALLARQAVVEGEATYMMNLWMMQKMMQKAPPREVVAKAVAMQVNMSMDQIREALKQPQVAEFVGTDLQGAMQSAESIPPFILDALLGAYLKGVGFVFAVHEQGWPAVEKLYTDNPPRSTEHILHPEKWLAREAPVAFEWPDFGKVPALREWELLESDVLGEFQWRTVFKEHDLAAEAESVAAGWGGDRYAVFKRRDSDATLLLLRTSWDSEADAKEFVDAYRRVLTLKYADKAVPTRVVQKGVDVFVVEGAPEASIDSLLTVVRKAKKKRT
jgi:hypothetical protein